VPAGGVIWCILRTDGESDPGIWENFRLDPSRAVWEIFGNPFPPPAVLVKLIGMDKGHYL